MSYCTAIETMQPEERKLLHKNYHDKHYGFPIHDDDELFGRLIMEINQAGLSWETILKKEASFRKAYHNFNIKKIAAYTEKDRERLMADAGIIRNKLKINAAIENAKTILALQKEFGSFEKWLDPTPFQFVKNENRVYAWPIQFVNDFSLLLQHLRLLYSGTIIGEMAREKLIPDHALAMSLLVRSSIERTECNLEEAIDYLKRKDLKFSTRVKGWQLLNYEGNTLGWINVLPNRINNYYPKEFKILSQKI